jgi:tetratricopeptide (TPR) repeat protein
MMRSAYLLVLLAASVAASRRLAISSVGSLRGGGGDDPLSEAKTKWSGWLGNARAKAASLQGSKAATDPALTQALSLIKKRTLSNCEKAVGLLRGAHTRDPMNDDVKLELADALNAVMRIKTHANALVIEGTLDTPGNKKVWKALGDEALPLARDVYKSRPGDVRALAVYADAFMFSCSAKGIVKQALSGTAKEYKRMANELRKHPKWDGNVGCVFLGGFYNVAPWPVGNKELAKKFLAEACNSAPTRRNLYYVGVNAYQMQEYEKAKAHFGKALKAGCGSLTEADFGEWMLDEARKGLKLAEGALQTC